MQLQLICAKCKQLKNRDDFSTDNKNTKRFFRRVNCKTCDNKLRKIRHQKKHGSFHVESTDNQEANATYDEIAKSIGCCRNTVIACERRAIDKLKTALTQLGIYSASDFI